MPSGNLDSRAPRGSCYDRSAAERISKPVKGLRYARDRSRELGGYENLKPADIPKP
jgi:hypothetical protein